MITQIAGAASPAGEAADNHAIAREAISAHSDIAPLISAKAEAPEDEAPEGDALQGDALEDTAPANFGLAAGRSYSGLRRSYLLNPSPDQTSFQVSAELLQFLLAKLAMRVVVDEAFYRARYPDIGEAIAQGQFASARHHYIHYGYREDRMPHRITVDDMFYRTTYPDILQGLRSGRLASAQAHFDNFGFKEGRLPYEGWTLF